MSYYKRQSFRPEQKRLNINEEHELMDWTERYGVSADKICEAVRAVGDRASDVVRYLIYGGNSNRLTNQ